MFYVLFMTGLTGAKVLALIEMCNKGASSEMDDLDSDDEVQFPLPVEQQHQQQVADDEQKNIAGADESFDSDKEQECEGGTNGNNSLWKTTEKKDFN